MLDVRCRQLHKPLALAQTGVLTFDTTEGPVVRVRKADFIGNRSYTSDKLRGQLANIIGGGAKRSCSISFDPAH